MDAPERAGMENGALLMFTVGTCLLWMVGGDIVDKDVVTCRHHPRHTVEIFLTFCNL